MCNRSGSSRDGSVDPAPIQPKFAPWKSAHCAQIVLIAHKQYSIFQRSGQIDIYPIQMNGCVPLRRRRLAHLLQDAPPFTS